MAVGEERPDNRFEHWVNFAASIVAPVTVLSAVLFYFGYVSARAQYGYFGVDVDTIGLSTRDYIQRSPQALLIPLLALTAIGISALLMHTAVRRRIDKVLGEGSTAQEDRLRRQCGSARWVGLAVTGAGVVLLLLYAAVPSVRDWAFYNLVTPLLIAAGAATVWYAERVLHMLTPALPGGGHLQTAALVLRRSIAILIAVVIIACLFWATATVAQWTGRGIAKYNAKHLDKLPTVILDTKERLYSTAGCRHDATLPASQDPCILEQALPMAPGQTYRYRYRHLRLLIQGHDRMFLIPDVWAPSDSTFVVPLDDSVRVRFLFENEPP